MKTDMNSSLRSIFRLAAGAGALALSGCAQSGTASHVETGDPSRIDASSQGTLVATTRAESGGGRRPAFEAAGEPEGIVRVHGQLYYLKDRGTTLIHGRQRVTNGMHLEKNGDVILADGRRVHVLEGWMVTTGGDVIEAPRYLR
jgi:hypothetical protein